MSTRPTVRLCLGAPSNPRPLIGILELPPSAPLKAPSEIHVAEGDVNNARYLGRIEVIESFDDLSWQAGAAAFLAEATAAIARGRGVPAQPRVGAVTMPRSLVEAVDVLLPGALWHETTGGEWVALSIKGRLVGILTGQSEHGGHVYPPQHATA
jgi:hypothetical protein